MPKETEDLIRRLEPVMGRAWAIQKLQEYINGRFSPTLKKAVEREVSELANTYNLAGEIILYPVPKRAKVSGEYALGQCQYGSYPLDAKFGLQEQDVIKHLGIFGATGSGKTTTAMGIIRQLCERGKPFLILDPKGTWQAIVRKDWAKNVKVLKLGSAYAPYTFDPFMPLTGMDIDTMIAEVVEVFCDSQFLGYGAKNLLLRACYTCKGRGPITLREVYREFRKMPLSGQKEKLWYSSTLRALESATTGILGRVLNSPDNVLFDRLMKSQVIILMDSLADHDQVAMFMGLMLNRIFWHRKLQGIKEKFKHLLVLEEFHVLSSAEKGKGESRIDFIVKMCREFSQGIMVLEQNPGNISQAVLGNLNTVISMNLGHQNDINAVGTAMVLDADGKSYLGKVPTGWAICRVKDRFPESILVKVDFEELDKSELSPEEIREHNKDFVMEAPLEIKDYEAVRVGEFSPFAQGIKLARTDRKILRYVKINDGANLKSTYLAQGLSYRRGNTIRKRLERAGLIESEIVSTETGQETRLRLTDRGENQLKNLEDSRRLGGEWHQATVEKVARHYKSMGFIAMVEHRDIDVFVDKGTEKLAVEAESLTGSKEIVHAVANIQKASRIADRVEVVVKDRKSARKLREAVSQSPVKGYRGLTIKLLKDYANSSSEK